MTSHFKFYPASSQVVFPPNAVYTFPTEANKAIMTTPRIPPKNGASFSPGNTIRFEFPAQGYVNPNHTTLVFDVLLTGYSNDSGQTSNTGAVWIQNNIQSLFNRVRLLYGAYPLEDIIDYNVFVRLLTETTTSNNTNFDQFTINEGIAFGAINSTDTRHARIAFVQSSQGNLVGVPTNVQQNPVISLRRYSVQLMLGLLNQPKYIPTKYMASQLAIEITLEQPVSCLMGMPAIQGSPAGVGTPTYTVQNLALMPEILEFDSSYDAIFYKGLSEGGIAMKFSKVHTYVYPIVSTIANILIPERARSVKSIFTIIRRTAQSYANDSHVTFAGTASSQTLDSYQYRIGGRYFPASPVQVSAALSGGGSKYIGGVESYMELQKALHMLGDYKLSCAVNSASWAAPYIAHTPGAVTSSTPGESDGQLGQYDYNEVTVTYGKCDQTGRYTFCCAINLETSNGAEISGLNAEEQSDISLQINWSGGTPPAAGTFTAETFVLYDAVMLLKPNNIVELIE